MTTAGDQLKASREDPAAGRSSAPRALAWAVALFDLFIVVFAAWTLSTSRNQYLRSAQQVTHNLAQVLEQNLQAMVSQIDLVLLTVKDEAEREDLPDPGGRIERSIRALSLHIKGLDAIRTADAHGVTNHGTSVQRVDPLHTIADRPYFQQLKEHPGSGLVVSPPLISRFSGKWVLVLARRLNAPGGGFAGIVYATVPLDQFGRLFASVDVGRRGSISLRGADLSLLARYPTFSGLDKLIGDTRVEGAYLDAVRSRQAVTHFTTHSRLDGEIRTYTFRRLSEPSFFLLVALGQADYLQPWRKEALLATLAITGLIILSLSATWVAMSAWQRQSRDRERLAQALAEVKALTGLLPICSHCKKVRDDRGYWNQIETYISEHTEATFTHGVCPDCAHELRREMKALKDQWEQE